MIKEYALSDTEYSFPNGGVIVDLPNGEKGIAVSIIQPQYFVENNIKQNGEARKVKILKLDGTEYMDLSEPELEKEPSSITKITRDEEFLYVTTYCTEYSYLAKYRMGTFKREWKKDLESASMQSITVDQDSVICFNMTDGSIDYFNKDTGEKTKSIDIKEKDGHSHHNLAANNLMLLAAVPGFDWIVNLPNQLKVFNQQGEIVNQKDIPTSMGTLNAISIDPELQLVYLAFDNKVAMFNSKGHLGTTVIPGGDILELNVDQETSSLIVSSVNMQGSDYNGGKLSIISMEAIKALTSSSSTKMAGELEESTQGHIL